MHQAVELAYAAGDHLRARALARDALERGAGASADDEQAASCAVRARAILAETTPDLFLSTIGALGLGLVTWLVYNYVL